VSAKNSGGAVHLGEIHGDVVAQTSSGSIIVGFGLQPQADSQLEVSGGDINVALPRGVAIDLAAESSGGKVISAIPITMTVSGVPKPGVLRGKINGGGPRLNLRTSSGDIRLNESAAPTQ